MGRPPPGPVGRSAGKVNYSLWQADIVGFLAELAREYGDVVSFYIGNSPCILVNGAAQVRELFSARESSLRKPEFVKDSNRGHWGDGLTTQEGIDWRMHRAALRPSFKAESVSARMNHVAACTQNMLDGWAPDSVAELGPELRVLTARIAARTVLDADLEGYESGANRSGLLPFEQAYGEDSQSIPGGDPSAPLIMVRPRAPRRMDSVIRIIDERIAGGKERSDVLSDLIRARSPDGAGLTRDEIIGEIMQMLYAGHLTIPFSLLNFWRDVAGHDTATRIETEADFYFATVHPARPSLSQTFCLAALKESLRLHPPAPILYREVETPFELGGFEFARDAAVWVCPQLLHRDARYFPNPDCFIPERFTPDGLTPKHKISGRSAAGVSVYIPFGAGPRTCIASHQALQQMALIGLLTAKQFVLDPMPDGSDKFRLRKRYT